MPHQDPARNGCPKARIEKGEIKITEQVKFATSSAKILPESDELLGEVATILREHPEVLLVSIEGHTDNRGRPALNLRLSQQRAASVVSWLISRGVEASRLTSQGYGLERPIDTNNTEQGRRNNRRVEFRIVRQEKVFVEEPQAPALPSPAAGDASQP
jgi:outer membrane protein OmpA-like peptidoglycan-associated protein